MQGGAGVAPLKRELDFYGAPKRPVRARAILPPDREYTETVRLSPHRSNKKDHYGLVGSIGPRGCHRHAYYPGSGKECYDVDELKQKGFTIAAHGDDESDDASSFVTLHRKLRVCYYHLEQADAIVSDECAAVEVGSKCVKVTYIG